MLNKLFKKNINKFISIHDIFTYKYKTILIQKGVTVSGEYNKHLHTYSDKNVYLFDEVYIDVNSGFYFTTENELIFESGLESVVFERHNKRRINFSKSNILDVEYAVGLGNNAYNNFYHFFLDILPRIYALYHPEILNLKLIKVFIPGNLDDEFKKILIHFLPPNCNLFSVDTNSNQILHSKNAILLPFFTEKSMGFLSNEVLQFVKNKVFDFYNIKESFLTNRNIYISRKLASKRKIKNEDELIKILSNKKYTTVSLEELSLRDQISLFLSSSKIVSLHGAGLTNLLWSNSQHVVEIFPSLNTRARHYEFLCYCCDHSYSKIILGYDKTNVDIVLSHDNIQLIDSMA